jgi:hypothetical protein
MASTLPGGWRQVIAATPTDADFQEFPRTPILSRKHFLDLAQEAYAGRVMAARDDRYGIVLNVQRGTEMRFECHVDSNPLTGLLFCTDHLAGEGGELVFAHDPGAADIDAVERDCSVIRPHAGHLIFFDGREHPHYARPLLSRSDVRIVAVMNFYTESFPESTRPQELNQHLFGQALAGLPGRNVGQGRRVADLRAADRRAAEHGGYGVEDSGLALGHAAGGVV